MSNNIILLVIILIIIGLVVYFYYNRESFFSKDQLAIIEEFGKSVQGKRKVYDLPPPKNKRRKTNKKVHFDDNVIYHFYDKNAPIVGPDNIESNDIDVDEILSVTNTMNNVVPSNLDNDNPEEMWDANFGLPLMTHEQKKKYISKIQKNYRNYEKSLGDFIDYQTDDSTIIKTDVTIDPFNSQDNQNMQGKTIKDIYDKQVEGPKAKPKKIKSVTDKGTLYENESEFNGGAMCGTKLHAFDGISNNFECAHFSDGF